MTVLEQGRDHVEKALARFRDLPAIHERELVLDMAQRLLAELNYYEKTLEWRERTHRV